MKELDLPDLRYLRAAVGWLELGNPSEAGEELAHISTEYLDHPDVLDVRWMVCAASGSWEAALQVAERLLEVAPERSSAWVHRAYALRRTPNGGLPLAWAALRPAFEKFPNESMIPYNLACYAAQFGRLEEAWDWLQKAIGAADQRKQIKELALKDLDLEPIWDRIRKL